MKNEVLAKIKTGSLRYDDSSIYEIIKNDLKKQELSFRRHQILYREIKHYEILELDYDYLSTESSFRNTKKLDEKKMREYIMGIFEN